MRKVLILNGPNLDKLGTREPGIYGATTLADIESACKDFGSAHGIEIDFRQSNDEAQIIQWLHEAAAAKLPIVFNPAAFTHYSVAIRDAAAMCDGPIIEVHLSNPIAREEFRHTSLISGLAKGTISGFGANSYILGLRALLEI
jgi:3-dehydroquinate dehydratase-2